MDIDKKKLATIDKIEIGMTAAVTRVIEYNDVKLFSELSGDTNPIHLDKNYALNSRYKKNIAHGLLCSSLFSGIFGTRLPGLGSIYTHQSLNFKRPIYIGDKVEAIVKVVTVDHRKKRVRFTTQCYVNSKICIDGEAEIYIP